ncbi:NUDIX hydrolase [Patescibacteria group bacterium]|nr:NUDIX hydrolase [Patescibacteria group bacterium]
MKEYSQEETNQFLQTLPKKYIGAAMILRNSKEEILVVKTNYHGGKWTLPGGSCEPYEDPQETAVRETLEEIGLNIRVGRLLYVDTVVNVRAHTDGLAFHFDGGHVSEADIEKIVLQDEEIVEYMFVSQDQDVNIFEQSVLRRFPFIVKALKSYYPIFTKSEE